MAIDPPRDGTAVKLMVKRLLESGNLKPPTIDEYYAPIIADRGKNDRGDNVFYPKPPKKFKMDVLKDQIFELENNKKKLENRVIELEQKLEKMESSKA